ncbi:MAG: discoidin domain-containing protein, partial [Gemmatimonadetes bacterium]|nr:discoidin domain-containing protein [Gemmatimonadota bacterium]
MKHSSVVQKVFVGLALSLAPVEAQRGYQLSGDEVVVDLAQHWRQWTIPAHLAHIDEAGSVRTRQLRTVYNVLEDRTLRRPIIINTDDPRIGTIDSTMQFDVFGEPIRNTLNELVFDYWVRPGISRVGSNPQLADNILDGDPTTFWEPNPRDPIEQWWIEVDLGRAVPVERLKLQFVGEELGDPFLQFIMLLSRRQSALLHEPNSRIGFQLFIPQDAPNTTQREYIFESEHTSPELPPASGVVSDRLLIEARKPS